MSESTFIEALKKLVLEDPSISKDSGLKWGNCEDVAFVSSMNNINYIYFKNKRSKTIIGNRISYYPYLSREISDFVYSHMKEKVKVITGKNTIIFNKPIINKCAFNVEILYSSNCKKPYLYLTNSSGVSFTFFNINVINIFNPEELTLKNSIFRWNEINEIELKSKNKELKNIKKEIADIKSKNELIDATQNILKQFIGEESWNSQALKFQLKKF